MRRTGAVVGAVVAAAAALPLVGCADGTPSSLPDPLPTDVPYAYHLQTESGSDGALLEGILELQDGCLVVIPEYEGMDDPVVPVIPIAATTWDGTTLSVDGVTADLGERIALGGGYHGQPGEDSFVPEGCTSGVDGFFTVGLR